MDCRLPKPQLGRSGETASSKSFDDRLWGGQHWYQRGQCWAWHLLRKGWQRIGLYGDRKLPPSDVEFVQSASAELEIGLPKRVLVAESPLRVGEGLQPIEQCAVRSSPEIRAIVAVDPAA